MKGKEKTNAFWHGLVWLGVFSVLFFAVLVICVPHADAASVVASGSCGVEGGKLSFWSSSNRTMGIEIKNGNNLTWTLDSSGTLTFSGTGKMEDYYYTEYKGVEVTDAPWGGKYCSQIKKVVIQSGVTSIGERAFWGCSNLKSVTIPDSVTSIGGGAFFGCSSLKSVTIPDSVESIGDSVVYETALYNNSANWSNGVLYVGNYLMDADMSLSGSCKIKAGTRCIADFAFYQCYNLTSVTIPSSVTYIGNVAFKYCESLKSVTIPDSVMTIGESAFEDTALYNNSAKWSNGVLYIGNHLIKAQESLSGSYRIKAGTRCIADYAFCRCKSMTKITIPDNVTSIGSFAFFDCSRLKGLTIPDSVTSIGEYAFCKCERLTSVAIPNRVTSIQKVTFFGCSSLKSVTIPDSVTRICDFAFWGCSSLTSVTVPKSVASVGMCAFRGCDSMKTVEVMNFNCKIGDKVFYKTPATIYGYENSTAQAYAKGNGLNFVIINCTHTYKNVVVPATTSKDGSAYNQCTVCGKKGKTVTIAKVSTVKLAKGSYIYTGAERTPTPIVQDANGKKLKLNTDYKVAYAKGRTECGTYKVVVAFKGNYSGKVTLKFKIKLGKVTGLQQMDTPGINVKWNAVVGAHGYIVQYYNTSTKEWVKWGSSGDEVPKTSWGSSAQQGSRKVRVCAYRMVNGKKVTGAWSDVVQMTAN